MKRIKILGVSLLLALGGCAVPAAAADPPSEWHSRATCVTDSTGHCSAPFSHPLGVAPVVQVTADNLTAIVHTYEVTASTFRVRVMRSETLPWANRTVVLNLSAFAPSVAPPPTTPPTTPATTASTTPPTSPPPAAGWPDASNTGVPDGTALSAYTGPCVITVDNTVIDAKTVSCDLDVRAAGVQISRSRITGSVFTPDSLTTTASFTLSDSEVSYPTITTDGRTMVGAANFTVLRSEVTGGNRGIYCRKNCTVRDSYVHGIMVVSSLHASALRMSQDSTVVHNSLRCDAPDNSSGGGCSADLTGYGDFEAVQNNLIQNNLFLATTGGFCAYGGSSAGKPFSGQAQDIRFLDNVFQRGTSPGDHGVPVCGFYGGITDFDPARPGNVWTGNTWDDGSVIAPA